MKAQTCPTCMACGKLVDGDGVKLVEEDKFMKDKEQEKVYHRHCLTCSRCTKLYWESFSPLMGQQYVTIVLRLRLVVCHIMW